jgi:hypothetical protein
MRTGKKSLHQLTSIIKELLPNLKERYRIHSLEIFGSYVRGEQRKNSDLDILISFDEVPSLFTFIRLENDLSDALGVKVDLVMRDNLKPSIAKNILDEAKPI